MKKDEVVFLRETIEVWNLHCFFRVLKLLVVLRGRCKILVLLILIRVYFCIELFYILSCLVALLMRLLFNNLHVKAMRFWS